MIDYVLSERCRLFDELDSSQLSQASISNASSYTLELKHPSKTPSVYGRVPGSARGAQGLLRETLANEVHNKISNEFGIQRNMYTGKTR